MWKGVYHSSPTGCKDPSCCCGIAVYSPSAAAAVMSCTRLLLPWHGAVAAKTSYGAAMPAPSLSQHPGLVPRLSIPSYTAAGLYGTINFDSLKILEDW